MPHAAAMAASGIIGNQLLSPEAYQVTTLQVYDIATGRGPRAQSRSRAYGTLGVVLDGKLFLIHSHFRTLVYDPQNDTWTMENTTPHGTGMVIIEFHSCVHEGQIVVFLGGRLGIQARRRRLVVLVQSRGLYQIRDEDSPSWALGMAPRLGCGVKA